MEQTGVAIAVSSRYKTVTRGTVNILTPKEAYLQHFFKRNILDHGPSGVIIRTDVFRRLNGFLELRNISDIDMWLRIAATYNIAEIETDLVYWREHPGQEINIANDVYLKYTFPILKKNLMAPDSPLDKKLVRYILFREKKMALINLIRFWKRSKDTSAFRKLLHANGWNLFDFIGLPFLKIYTSPKIYVPKLS
jgi:hypothetical protein